MRENTKPGFFVGWKIESSWRFRNVLLIGDYQKVLAGYFRQRSLLEIREKEVILPEKVVLPLNEAYRISLETMKGHAPPSDYAGTADTPLPPGNSRIQWVLGFLETNRDWMYLLNQQAQGLVSKPWACVQLVDVGTAH